MPWPEGLSAQRLTWASHTFGVSVCARTRCFAVQLFREAAQKGSGMGACYLGDMYYFGVGVTKSETDARHWFELGSKLRNIPAKVDLALLLLGRPDQAEPRSRDRAIA